MGFMFKLSSGLNERDYVTFGFLLSQIRLSSVVCLSYALLSRLKISAIFLRHFVGLPFTYVQNFTEIVPGKRLHRGRQTQEG